jgi:hypothetical protein
MPKAAKSYQCLNSTPLFLVLLGMMTMWPLEYQKAVQVFRVIEAERHDLHRCEQFVCLIRLAESEKQERLIAIKRKS